MKIGFVGSGFIARFQAAAIRQVRGIEIAGLVRRRGSQAVAEICRSQGLGEAKIHDSIGDLAKHVDAIAIYVPNFARIEVMEQIAAAEMANSVLSDEILEGMEKIDQLVLQVKEAEATLAAVKNDLLKFCDGVAAECAVVSGDVARLEALLAEAEQALPATLKEDYQRVIRGKGAEGMAPVEDMVCQGCGQQITLNMLNELMLSHAIFCRSCGSLLYMAE